MAVSRGRAGPSRTDHALLLSSMASSDGSSSCCMPSTSAGGPSTNPIFRRRDIQPVRGSVARGERGSTLGVPHEPPRSPRERARLCHAPRLRPSLTLPLPLAGCSAAHSLPRKWELLSGGYLRRAGGPIVIPDRGDDGGTLTAPQEVRHRRQGSNSGPFRLIPLAAAAQPRLAPRSQAPLRASRRAPTASPRRPTSRASSPPPSAPPPTSAPPAAGAFAR